MKTLGQMLMDAYAKADTIETVSLVGDRLHIQHKANANEQIEAAFLAEFPEWAGKAVGSEGYMKSLEQAVMLNAEPTDTIELVSMKHAYIATCLTVGINITPKHNT